MSEGRVRALDRYPVKSMGGEPLERAAVRVGQGLEGDRRLALIDEETGHVVSAKQPRKWGALLSGSTRWTPAGVVLTLPDGATLRADAPDVDARLSAWLGRRVRLVDRPPDQASFAEAREARADAATPLAVAAPAGTFFDFAPLHLVTTSTLAALAAHAPGSRFDVARFRPNLVVDTGDAPGFPEDAWVGRALAVGETARLAIVSTCPRCVMTTLPQPGLDGDAGVLRAIAETHLRLFELLGRKLPTVGVYATVVADGEIAVGDTVRPVGGARLHRAGTLLRAIKRAIVR